MSLNFSMSGDAFGFGAFYQDQELVIIIGPFALIWGKQ